jgi:hypothetical protein
VFHAGFVEHAYPRHTHDAWTVFVVDEGAIAYDLERRHRGTAGASVTLLPPHVVHDGRPATTDGFRKRVLYVGTELLPAALTGRAVDEPDRTLAQGLRDLREANVREALALRDAAAVLHASPAHLIRCFSRAFGIPPHRYLVSRRTGSRGSSCSPARRWPPPRPTPGSTTRRTSPGTSVVTWGRRPRATPGGRDGPRAVWRTGGDALRGLAPAERRREAAGVVHDLDRHAHRRLLIATLIVTPAAVFVGLNVLQYGLGVPHAADWMDPVWDVSGLAWLATTIVLAGPVAALLLAATRIFPVRLVRDGDAWEVRIRVRLDRWAIAIAALSLVVGGILAGHLLAENLACMLGVSVSC